MWSATSSCVSQLTCASVVCIGLVCGHLPACLGRLAPQSKCPPPSIQNVGRKLAFDLEFLPWPHFKAICQILTVEAMARSHCLQCFSAGHFSNQVSPAVADSWRSGAEVRNAGGGTAAVGAVPSGADAGGPAWDLQRNQPRSLSEIRGLFAVLWGCLLWGRCCFKIHVIWAPSATFGFGF